MQQYVVKPNDTLYSIAKEFDVPLAQIIKANPNIKDPKDIHAGQTILIPNMPEIPDQIGVIESNAVSIIDDIYSKNWQSANGRVRVIKTAANELTSILREAQVPNNIMIGLDTVIRILEQNVELKKPFPTISQANRIMLLIADALDYFNVIIPTDVIRLAYFARQIIVNVEQNDWAEAYQNYRRVISVWEGLSTLLQDNYAEDVFAFNQALANMNDVLNKKDYQKAIDTANAMLHLIDEIETDFEQQNT